MLSVIGYFAKSLKITQIFETTPFDKLHMIFYWPSIVIIEDMVTRIGTIDERDGQTDTARRHRPRLCIASRGKNGTRLTSTKSDPGFKSRFPD